MGLTPPVEPTYRILANSADVTLTIAERFISLRITDEAGLESDLLELTLADHDPLAPVTIPERGAELEVFLGYDNNAQRMGVFVIDEVELSGWPGQMTLRGRAAPYDKTPQGKTNLQTQKSRDWPKATKLGDMVKKIASEHGMEPVVAEALAGVVLPHYDQTEESDLSFLVRVAGRYDAIAKPAGGKLLLAKRGASKSASGEALPPIVLTPPDCTDYRLSIAARDKPGTVLAYWHDKKTAKRIEVKLGDGEPVRRLRHWYPDEAAAKSAAQAELDKRARGEFKVSVTLPGDPTLSAESPLTLVGFRAGVAGDWLVTRVEHALDAATGYVCAVEAEKPGVTESEEG